MKTLRTELERVSALQRVTMPGTCPLCGRPLLVLDTGGVCCPDEDSTCWRDPQTLVNAVAEGKDV